MKKVFILWAILTFCFELQVFNSFAQPGNLDLTFSGDGIQFTAIGSGNDVAYSVAVQPDGKIVVAGYATVGTYADFAVIRYNSDGTLDNTFSDDGKQTTSVGTLDDGGSSVAIQSDGKIVVAGTSYMTNNDFAVVRYNSDGTLDNTFSGDGIQTTAVGGTSDYGYSVAIQPDGKIVVAGNSANGVYTDFAVVRYNSDGSLDNTFSSDGVQTTTITSGTAYCRSVAIQSDGKIVMGGNSWNGSFYDYTVVRYNSDGSLDNTFSGDGIQTTNVGPQSDVGCSVAIQSDGKIILAGYAFGSNWDFGVVRYNSDGSLDNTFNGSGIQTTDITNNDDYAYSVKVQPDGKIVVAGAAANNFGIVRYNSDGSLDNTFGGDGMQTTFMGSSYGYSVALQTDTKIVMAGNYYNGTNNDFGVVRYLGMSVNLDSGLVAHYPFNGNANDESENGNDGTINNATLTNDRFGNADKAYSFNGTSSYINIPYNINLSPTEGTVCAWVKTSVTGSGLQQDIFGQPYGMPQLVIDPSGKAAISWRSATFNFPGVSSSVYVDNSDWHFLTGVYNSTSFKIYVDGVLDNSSTTTESQYSCDAPFQIGGFNNPAFCGGGAYSGQFMNGVIDDISIYNRALSEAEILALYNDSSQFSGIPVAAFTADDSTITVGSSVTFTDNSTPNPISWNWSFAGGTPATSSLQNPVITYNTPGTYDVTLTVTNSYGSDTLTKTSYITVSPASTDYLISQGGTVVACTGNFYDSGGNGGNYGSGQSYVMTFCADTSINEQIQFDFSSFTLGGTDCGLCYADEMYVYDGTSTGAPEYGVFSMSCGDYATYWWKKCGAGYLPMASPVTAIQSTSGCFTFGFNSTDHFCPVGDNAGWAASISCVPSVPVIPDFTFTAACVGSATSFTDNSQNATSWEWNFGDGNYSTLQNPGHIYNSTGTFNVTLTINQCFSITKPVTISNAPPVAAITAGGPLNFCEGDSVILNAGCAGCTYLWNNGETTASVIITQTGLYNVTVTNGCGSDDAAPVFVTVNYTPVPVISANGTTEFCQGDSVILTSSPSASYLWNNGATTQSIVIYAQDDYSVTTTDACGSEVSNTISVTVNSLPSPPVITPGGPTIFCEGTFVTLTSSSADAYSWSNGEHTQSINVNLGGDYYVTITDINGCQAVSAAETVTVNPNPATPVITTSGATVFCDGGSVTLTSSASSSYLWSTGAATQSIYVDASGTFTVTITDANGCTGESSALSVSETPAPVQPVISSIGSPIICDGQSVTLYSTSADQYLWSDGETTQYISVAITGNYTVTVTYSCGTSVSDAFTVTVNPNPAVPVITPSGTVSVCTGDSVTLTCSTADLYYWSTGANTQSIDAWFSGDYSVIVTDLNGCSAASALTTVVVIDPLNGFSASGAVFYLPVSTVDFTSSINGTITGYLWNFGDGSTSTAANPSYTYSSPGLYSVSLTVTDGNGCVESYSLNNYIWIEQVFSTTEIITGTTDNLSGVYFDSPNYGVITTTTGNVLITTDGGLSWTPSTNTGISYITGVSFYNGSIYISGLWGYIAVSYDNGLNWYDYNLLTNAIFNGLYFSSTGAGYAVGAGGTIYNYNGVTWIPQTTGISFNFNAISGWGTYAWAVGDSGTIWGYNGTSWNALFSGVSYNLSGVHFINDLIGYAVSSDGIILSTVDGGLNWIEVFNGINLGCSLTGITGPNADTLWAVGNDGIIYQTQNAGISWDRYSIGSPLDLSGIYYSDNIAYIAGKNGKLYEFGSPMTHLPDNTIKAENKTDVFVYPNPFDNTATVRISANYKIQNAKIEIYDLYGKSLLVIDNINTNEFTISRNNLPDGMYFYRIGNQQGIIGTGKLVVE